MNVYSHCNLGKIA